MCAHPRIYVASLSDYNHGRLHGTWLDADQDAEKLYQATSEMIAASGIPFSEEWAIHDYEGFEGLTINEFDSFEYVSAIAAGVAQHGEPFAAWVQYVGDRAETDFAALATGFEEHYQGQFDSPAAYAEHLADECGISEELEGNPSELWRMYVSVDFEKWGKDLAMELHMPDTRNGGVFVFLP